ncbi:MAG: helix-turn-helix transcriptional regulator [Holophagales bacterium]|nr:helix-turn-helix transcriptional regulator [Holophagales bacterium]
MIRSYGDSDCAIAQSLEILGDGWTILVLREAFLGTRRFADFEARLAISKNVLSARLAHLVETGLLEKEDVGRFGERYEYGLTAKGKDLMTVMTALRQWGDRWVFGEGREPLLVVDRRTAEPILPVRIRRADGSVVGPSDLAIRPGPGASAEALDRWRARTAAGAESSRDRRSARSDNGDRA